jgi:hypothetical protein
MQSNGRRILLTVMSIMVVLAMVTLWPTESQAQRTGTTVTVTPVPRPVRVPEPSISVLLLLGIGLTGLAGYSLKCLKQGE